MSMQIVFPKLDGKEVIFEMTNRGVNLTDALRKIVDKYFVEKSYMEEDEEIFYRTMNFEDSKKLLNDIKKAEAIIFEDIKNAKGNSLKDEKIMQYRDLSLLKTQIIEMLLQDCNENQKLLALI